MKVTALVTLSLAAALILFDFDPTTGIRLNNQYGPDKGNSMQLDSNGSPIIPGGPGSVGSSSHSMSSSSISSSNKLNSHDLKKKSSISSASSASPSSSLSTSSSASSSSATSSLLSSPSSSKSVKLNSKRGKSSQLTAATEEDMIQDEENLGGLIESGIWPVPIHFWNYLPHNTNSINNYPAHDVVMRSVSGSGGSGSSNNINSITSRGGGSGGSHDERELNELEGLEDHRDPNHNHHASGHLLGGSASLRNRNSNSHNRGVGGGSSGSSSSSSGSSSHHLSFLPDPDNSVSINVPSNEFLGRRLAALNEQLFSNLAPPQHYDHHHFDEEDDESDLLPALSILKRTSSPLQQQQQQHSSSTDSAPMGSRKTEDRKRANRPYDVPQIECPPADDGMERFACPSPDRQGRYRCIDDHVLCDGFVDCPKEEDEDRHACMFYKTTKAHLDVLADALLRWARGRR